MRFSNQIKPVRKALLIGSPGNKGADYLYSVGTDIDSIRNLLLSSRGGKWKEEEIITLLKPDVATVASVVEETIADYFFVFYAGHGYETIDGKRNICLVDADVSDFFLLNKSIRQLVVLDCCREKEYPAISGIPEDDWVPYDGIYPERDAFDKYILQSPPGKIIIHATKSGFASWEDKRGRGGVFTTGLVLAAKSIKKNEIYSPISIVQVLKRAKKILKQNGEEQEPEIVYSKGDLQVPFVLSVKETPKPIYFANNNSKAPRKNIRQESSNAGLLKAGLFLFVLAIIANNSD
jgi:Caspase domain